MDALIEHATFSSEDFKSDGARDRLETELSGLEGVRDVEVDTDNHTAQIAYDPSVISGNAIREAVESLGYTIASEEGTAQGGA